MIFERDQRIGQAGGHLLLDFSEPFELANRVLVSAAVGKLVALVALRKMLGGQNVASLRLNQNRMVGHLAVLGVKPENVNVKGLKGV